MLYKNFKRNSGFTLLELMIVIGIMAVLLSVFVPSMQRARDQSKLSVCLENVKNMATAVEMYSMDNKQTPPETSAGLQKLVDTGYMKTVPVEPVAGVGAYKYERADLGAGGALYTIWCGPLLSSQNHGTLGVPPGHPFYTPAAGQESGVGI